MYNTLMQPEEESGYAAGDGPDSGGEKPDWQFKPDDNYAASPAFNDAQNTAQDRSEPVEWTASEYIAHHKNAGWFAALGLITAVLSILVFLLTRGDRISAGVVILAGIAFGIFAARQPQVLQYGLNESGIRIGDKFYGYGEFKSFSILKEGAFSSITLLPLKRFMPPISIYYAPEDEERIVHLLSAVLPVEQHQEDRLEQLMRRLRF
jgi:hypothetical protein